MSNFEEIVSEGEAGFKKIPVPLLIGGVLLIAFFLVRKAQTASNTTSQTPNVGQNLATVSGSTTDGTTTTTTTDTSGFQQELDALSQLVSGYQATAGQTATALNTLSSGLQGNNSAITTALDTNNTALNNSIAQLKTDIDTIGTTLGSNSQAEISAISGLGNTLTSQLSSNQTATSNAISSANTATTNALSSLQSAITSIISPLTSQVTSLSNVTYQTLGEQSAASCISSGGNVDWNCLFNLYPHDKINATGYGQNTAGANYIVSQLKTLYPNCYGSDGTADLVCVGKKMAGVQ